jgi:hypothetical protein
MSAVPVEVALMEAPELSTAVAPGSVKPLQLKIVMLASPVRVMVGVEVDVGGVVVPEVEVPV